ncbi:hypothetical protein V7S43_003506 [Phytophthora oleae]|uniref:Uncharacterized protein n=1 Tax=Phytophthora oleae TaxID=2107226 RepID=A0ABD3G0K3_9STRA
MPASTAAVPKFRRPRQRRARRVRSKKRKMRKRKKKRGVYPKRGRRFDRGRVSDHVRVAEPLLTSWFDVGSFADETQVSGWSALAIATPSSATDADDNEEVSEHPVNSVVKLRLFPTPTQKS